MTLTTTEQTFLDDVKHHKIKILMDNGVYRHVRFSEVDSTDMYFDLITGPGYLLYRGDMGCYEFERLNDMFGFFGKKTTKKDSIYINPDYWAEKLQACCIYADYKVFDNDTLQKQLKEIQEDFAEDLDEDDKEEFDNVCEWQFQTYYENIHEAYNDVCEFDFNNQNPFQDMFIDGTPEVFSSKFIWACYAISWGIQKYYEHKTKTEEL